MKATYGYCAHCEHRRELVMAPGADVLMCHVCDAVDVYQNKAEYEAAQEALDSIVGGGGSK